MEDQNEKSKFTETIKCSCGHIFSSVKLKEETPICCPQCKHWTVFKEVRVTKTKKREGDI